MEVKFLGDIPKITIDAVVIQTIKDYAHFWKNKMAFGGIFKKDKNGDIYITEIYPIPQKSGYYTFDIDLKEWEQFIDNEQAVNNVCDYSMMGVLLPTSQKFLAPTSTEMRDFTDNIGKIYNTYIYMRADKDGNINLGIVDSDANIVIASMDYDIDYSVCGESDDYIKKQLEVVKSLSYSSPSTSYSSNLDKSYSYDDYDGGYYSGKTWPNNTSSSYTKQAYVDAKINTENPDYVTLV